MIFNSLLSKIVLIKHYFFTEFRKIFVFLGLFFNFIMLIIKYDINLNLKN